MPIVETRTLTGAALDWAVAQCEDCSIDTEKRMQGNLRQWQPSVRWSQGGQIIDRERIRLDPRENEWQAQDWAAFETSYGPTALIAAMRCYIASKLGDMVDIPDNLEH